MNRKGVKTSEFWITMIAMMVGALNEILGTGLNAEQLAMVWGPAAAYVASRGLAKMKTPAEASEAIAAAATKAVVASKGKAGR